MLGGNDNHAIGRLGPVNRRGRGALEHLDALDIGRVEVGDPVNRVLLVGGDGGRGPRQGYLIEPGRDGDVA